MPPRRAPSLVCRPWARTLDEEVQARRMSLGGGVIIWGTRGGAQGG